MTFKCRFKLQCLNIIMLSWSHYLGDVSPELQADVDVLNDILMFREDEQQGLSLTR